MVVGSASKGLGVTWIAAKIQAPLMTAIVDSSLLADSAVW